MQIKMVRRGSLTLDSLIERARNAANGSLAREFRSVGGGLALKLAEDGLSARRNAQGRAWAPARDKKPLSWMKDVTVTLEVRGDRVRLVVRGPKFTAPDHSGAKRVSVAGNKGKLARTFVKFAAAAGHKVGRWVIPARRILPKNTIPKRWAEPILREMGLTWKQVMSAGRKPKK